MSVETRVIEPVSFDHLAKIMAENTTVLDFCAKWCGPCKNAAEPFRQMSLSYPNVKFVKVDIDATDSKIAEYFQVKSLPTFIVVKEGKNVYRKEGYNPGVFPEIKNFLQ